MRNEIAIDPLDGIAHVRGDLRRNEAELFHPDLDDLGARRCRRNDENERAEYMPDFDLTTPAALEQNDFSSNRRRALASFGLFRACLPRVARSLFGPLDVRTP